MKTKINIDDFLSLLYWIKMFFLFEGKPFNYQNLFDQAETYKLKDTPLDVSIHHIDDLMVDAYIIYYKLKSTEKQVDEVLSNIHLPSFNKNLAIEESKHYQRIFEDLIENYKYENPEIRGIQKNLLSEKMKEYIAVEDYENAAKVRDIINGK